MELVKRALQASLIAGVIGTSAFGQSLSDAKKAIDAEQYQQAKSVLKKLIAAQPKAGENYFFLGNVYLKTDYTDSAKTVFSQGVAADAGNALNYIGLGSVELANNNAAGAKADIDKALTLVPKKDNDPYIYAAKALISADKPDYETAISYLEKAKAMDAKDAEVYLALGDAYRGLKRNNEAYTAYRTATELDKNLLRANIELGVLNKRSKAFQESVDVFNSVIAANPGYGPAYRELAETNLNWSWNVPDAEKQAKLQAAINSYKKYLDLTDRSIDSRVRYADFLVYANDYKALEQEAQEMTKQDQSNPKLYRYLGISAYENGNYPASVQAYKDFFAKVEQRRIIPLDYVYYGKAQYKTGDPQAFTNLEKAVTLDSTLAEQFSTFGADARKEKKYAEAAKFYDLAIRGPKNSPNAVNNLFYLGLSNYFDFVTKPEAQQASSKEALVRADSAFSKLNTLAPTFSTAYIYRARIAKQLDDQKDPKGLAIPYYEKYLEIVGAKPENLTDAKNKNDLIESYNYLGASYAKKDLAKSKAYLKKTLELDPANAYATGTIKALGGSK